jgi:quercetin dioxygenase-like cupin family protein
VKLLDAVQAARNAVRAHHDRPATAVLHDSPDARVVVFNLMPGQAVAPHTSTSTVQLTVLGGGGFLSGMDGDQSVEHPCSAGDVAVYAPGELHGMRAVAEELLLLATITPRPGAR